MYIYLGVPLHENVIDLFDSRMLCSSIYESLRSLAGCFARCVKTGKHVIKRTSNTNTKYLLQARWQIRFLLSPFPIVSVAIWITVWVIFNWLQDTEAKLFCIWNFLSAVSFFGIRESPSRALWFINGDFCTETRFVCFLVGQYLFSTIKLTWCHFISAITSLNNPKPKNLP